MDPFYLSLVIIGAEMVAFIVAGTFLLACLLWAWKEWRRVPENRLPIVLGVWVSAVICSLLLFHLIYMLSH